MKNVKIRGKTNSAVNSAAHIPREKTQISRNSAGRGKLWALPMTFTVSVKLVFKALNCCTVVTVQTISVKVALGTIATPLNKPIRHVVCTGALGRVKTDT